MAGFVVSWGQRAKLLSITSENSVDGAYRLKRATQSMPQLRHLLLVILFGADYNTFQVIFLLIFSTHSPPVKLPFSFDRNCYHHPRPQPQRAVEHAAQALDSW